MPLQWNIEKKPIQTLFFLYLISNIFLLLNTQGIYWDDWVIYNQSFNEIKNLCNQLTGNSHLFEYIHQSLSDIGNGVAPYRITTFIVYFLAGLFLYFILLDIKTLSRTSAFYIALLFLILPVNNARIALCDLPYGLFLCVFFFAFWLLTQYINKNGPLLFRLTILLLFYLSFFVNSLLVFYAIVVFYTVYKITDGRLYLTFDNFKSAAITFIRRYLDFLILPILFFYIKTHYFAPYGLYKNYNSVSADYLNILFKLLASLKTAFYDPLIQSFIISGRFWGLFFITFTFLYFYLRKNLPKVTTQTKQQAIHLLQLGFVFFTLAIFPYVTVGKLPVLSNFDSRHMLLTPLGISLVLYSLILLIQRRSTTFAHLILITIITSCILKNMHDQTQYLKDWFYQIALEEHYKTNDEIKNNTTFLFKSNIPWANNRSIQFYEHNGLLKQVFGNDKRFMGNNLRELQTYANYKQYERYNFSSWIMKPPILIAAHKAQNHDTTQKLFFHLLFCMFENDVIFRREAKQLITMDVEHV